MRSARPADYVDPASPQPAGKSMAELAQQNGGVPVTEPEEVAAFALDGVAAGRFWLLPESERSDGNIRRRTDSIGRKRLEHGEEEGARLCRRSTMTLYKNKIKTAN
ncbi:hypothetical protein D3C87_1237270 [compost metagenome]